jgi:hypothetical protein
MAVKVRKDAKGNTVSSDAQYNIGPDQVQMNRNQVGVNTLTAQGPNADNIVGANASAQRKGVDPAKFAAFQKQNTTQEQAGAPMSYADILKSITQGGKMSTNVPSKPPTAPTQGAEVPADSKKAPNAGNQQRGPIGNALREADNRLLDQMLTIARLR